jgi:uncharacterized protein YlzI (FlbEa/FlbD family)
MLITLTGDSGEKFDLNVELIETIVDRVYRGGCEIVLWSGRSVIYTESRKDVAAAANSAFQERNKTVYDFRKGSQ